ncbi:hypothetical protein L373_02129 [Klebsiella michiganensis]|uniref:Uncharacterized protein n=1 Tax=Klebsiella michiganensis TaxID=1134687 RepID=A0A7H5A9K2_9ENTR|nr:hypothetical protein HMPREF9686_02740 [Klebsiella michiganensis]EWF89628.1 hypothetical protein L373_02129 [Klebsiella michiganensis]CAB1213613.1 hypothetical protein SFB9_1876 [Klebsiella michiganensis]SBL15249.1 Uncharacterised protein [Klebsiella michiganensis]
MLLPYLDVLMPVFIARNYFSLPLSTAGKFSGYFLNVLHMQQRRSDGPGANVNLRNLWLNSVLNAVLRVSIVSPRTFLISLLN